MLIKNKESRVTKRERSKQSEKRRERERDNAKRVHRISLGSALIVIRDPSSPHEYSEKHISHINKMNTYESCLINEVWALFKRELWLELCRELKLRILFPFFSFLFIFSNKLKIYKYCHNFLQPNAF